MYHLHEKISHTSQPEACHLRMTKTKVNLIQDPGKISWAQKLFINITFKGSPNKYDSNYETTFSENPMYLIFLSQLLLNPCTSQIQNLCLFCQLIMLNKTSLKMIHETLIDIYIKSYSCLRIMNNYLHNF